MAEDKVSLTWNEQDRKAKLMWEDVLPHLTPEVINQLRSGPMVQALTELERCRHEPRMLLAVAHGFVELIVNTVIEEKCILGKKISTNHRDFPHSIKCTILRELGLLSAHHYRLLNWFRDLRNDSAHKWNFELTAGDLQIIADPELRDPKNFNKLCTAILVDLFTVFKPIVAKAVMPILHREDSETSEPMVSVPAPKYLIALQDDPKTIEVPAGEHQRSTGTET